MEGKCKWRNEEKKERRMKKSWRMKEKKRVPSCEEKAVTVYKNEERREMKQQKQKHGRRHTSPRRSSWTLRAPPA